MGEAGWLLAGCVSLARGGQQVPGRGARRGGGVFQHRELLVSWVIARGARTGHAGGEGGESVQLDGQAGAVHAGGVPACLHERALGRKAEGAAGDHHQFHVGLQRRDARGAVGQRPVQQRGQQQGAAVPAGHDLDVRPVQPGAACQREAAGLRIAGTEFLQCLLDEGTVPVRIDPCLRGGFEAGRQRRHFRRRGFRTGRAPGLAEGMRFDHRGQAALHRARALPQHAAEVAELEQALGEQRRVADMGRRHGLKDRGAAARIHADPDGAERHRRYVEVQQQARPDGFFHAGGAGQRGHQRPAFLRGVLDQQGAVADAVLFESERPGEKLRAFRPAELQCGFAQPRRRRGRESGRWIGGVRGRHSLHGPPVGHAHFLHIHARQGGCMAKQSRGMRSRRPAQAHRGRDCVTELSG